MTGRGPLRFAGKTLIHGNSYAYSVSETSGRSPNQQVFLNTKHDIMHNIILNSVRLHNHFITQGNYKATCFDYRLVILRPILSIVSQDTMHTLGSHRVYIHEIHQIKSFVSKDVMCILFLQEWDT